ncbi:glycosyltransferase family 2 protein [Mucilaginibacter boryungensis]|uniref:Glycosyltransferase n=1 Tax=Mucilaginibacter boryungensis TaxID=768480 RepID=A0ABR9XF32_9SPHI|nr:glycosyltransferase family 2 protein [Mucilaginibacter boryungensis]MBE9665997.1 glycosyltransferase [Mucilaginibacter boryungensis]
MKYPLVSIIIPVYNAEKFIEASLRCALNQTWPNVEVIVVDDGSTDNSLAIINSFTDKRVIVINQKNQGASTAKQVGLNNVSGDYIQYLDADDLIAENKIEKQVNALINNHNKIAICKTAHFFTGDDPYTKNIAEKDDFLKNFHDSPLQFLINMYGGYTLLGNMIQPNSFLTPRNLIEKAGPWNENLTLDDDGEYFCRVILQSEGIIYQPDVLNYYRKYHNYLSLSGAKNKQALISQVTSVWLKHQHLLALASDTKDIEAIHNATNKNLSEILVNNYFEEPAIRGLIIDYKKLLNPILFPAYTNIGSNLLNTISKVFGWKTAKFLQYNYTKLKKIGHLQ